MESILFQRLSSISGGKYDFLKLSQVFVSKKEQKAELVFLYPIEQEETVSQNRAEIEGLISNIIGGKLNKEIRLIKSCFFADSFLDELMTFMERYPTIASSLKKEDITVTSGDEATIVCIGLNKNSYDYAVATNIINEIKEHFYYQYCEPMSFELSIASTESVGTQNIDKYVQKTSQPNSYLEKEGGRYITVENRDEFIGSIIYDDAAYISDAKVSENAVLCGKIENFSILSRKPKTPDETDTKKFYKFKLRDFTGAISCLYFPTKKTENIVTNLCDGKAIIASGKIIEDNYSGNSSLVFQVRSVTLCTLPKEFTENRIMRKVADEYVVVNPEPYIKPIQGTLFDIAEEVPPALKNKKFCVFDIETTGLDPENSEITEIGAVLVEDGSIKETFSTLISIQNSVPAKITQLTGIKDSDLVGKPSVKDVLADFFKFSYGMPLVGQNVSFDYGFISTHGAKHHIHFDNERIDTITLARKYLKNMKNFTLKNIAEKLDIKNEEAHRALSDAVATAEVFIKLSKM